ncbi:hypothetical protein ILYODFUR_037810 [Ilyodon furcidens]|uniref:Uncharacterized protein n=1 Tax=Ilyodon furcidens TaxID=33524 RepID=A0ABV0TES3_9TELE
MCAAADYIGEEARKYQNVFKLAGKASAENKYEPEIPLEERKKRFSPLPEEEGLKKRLLCMSEAYSPSRGFPPSSTSTESSHDGLFVHCLDFLQSYPS